VGGTLSLISGSGQEFAALVAEKTLSFRNRAVIPQDKSRSHPSRQIAQSSLKTKGQSY
jgi:hypothetical protein